MIESILTIVNTKNIPFSYLTIQLKELYGTLTPSALIQYPKTTKKEKPNNT